MEKDKKGQDHVQGQPRRAYVAPRVEESAPFEHLILSCTHSTVVDCEADDPRDPPPLFS